MRDRLSESVLAATASAVLLASAWLGVRVLTRPEGIVLAQGTPPSATATATEPAERPPMTVVGQLGGASHGLAVEGTTVFVGVGPRLVAVDASDPRKPTKVGESEVFSGLVADVAVAGDYAVVAVSPPFVGQGDASRSAVEVVDVSDPSVPHRVGGVDLPGVPAAVAVAGGVAYVAAGRDGLEVVDVGDPVAPRLVGSLETDGDNRDIAVAGDHAFVADRSRGLVVVDVSAPAAPRHVADLEVFGAAQGIALDRNTAYIISEDAARTGLGQLTVVDIADPARPRAVATLATRDVADAVAVANPRVFVVGGGIIEEFDVSVPAAPVAVHAATVVAEGLGGDVVVAGGLAYVGVGQAWVGSGVHIIDVRDPLDFAFVGQFDTLCCGRKVAVGDRYVYVGGRRLHPASENLVVVDARDPSAPSVAAELDGLGQIHDIAFQGSTAYIANTSDYRILGDLAVLDIADPPNAAALTRLSLPGPFGVEVVDANAFVAAQGGFLTVSVSDRLNPRQVAILPGVGALQDLAVVDGYAIALVGGFDRAGWSVVTIDVRDPLHPRRVASLAGRGLPEEIVATLGYAFVASRAGVQVIDLHDPASLKELRFVEVPGEPVAIAVSGSRAYVPYWGENPTTGALAVLDIGEPGAACLVDTMPLPSAPLDVTVSGGLVYVGDGDGGLFILRDDTLTPPTQTATPQASPTATPSATVTPTPRHVVFLPLARYTRATETPAAPVPTFGDGHS